MELLDVYDDTGKRTGKVVERLDSNMKLSLGERIAVAIIYIENSNGEFLIQKTSKQRGSLYSATGGHVQYNEEPIDTIKREVQEELGIDITKENIIDIGYLIFDFPLRFIFYLKKDIELDDIILKKDEVESVSYMNISELTEVIKKGLMHKAHAKILKIILDYKKNKK